MCRPLIILVLLSWPVVSQANGNETLPPVSPQAETDQDEGEKSKTSRMVDLVHEAISGGVTGLADRLDRFFSDERTEAELQTTRVRVRPTVEFREDGDHRIKMPLQLNLVLPRTEKKWQLRLTRTFDDDEPAGEEGDESLPPPTAAQDDQATTFLAFVYTPVSETLRNYSVRVGPRFQDGQIKLAAALRFRYTAEYTTWISRFRQTFFYDGDEFGTTSRLDFDRPVDNNKLFRSASSATFSESSEGLDLQQTFLWRWFVSEIAAVSPAFTVNAHTHPQTVSDEYRVAVPYRTRWWKDWLAFTITPQLSYQRDNSFDREASLFLSLEATF